MKRIPAFLLAVIILASIPVFDRQPRQEITAYAEADLEEPASISEMTEADADGDDTESDLPPLTYSDDELVVGTTMPMYGTFFTSIWGNGSSDRDVRSLIHGYNLVEWDSDNGESILNPVVVWDCEITENDDGDHIYTFTLSDDLQYCDGSTITVWDYAFSFLLRMDPELAKLGGTPEVLNYLAGYDAYISDRKAYVEQMDRNGWAADPEDDSESNIPVFSGIRVLDDTRLSITISNEILPVFFELGLLDCNPYPIRLLAPGCTIEDNGDGVLIRGPFHAAVLENAILGEEGYLTHPGVTSGPYRLVSFDGEEAQLERNEYYQGDSHGLIPSIERIVFRRADPETMFTQLTDCEYGLLTRITSASQIRDGMDTLERDPRFTSDSYPRSGLSFIGFNRENEIFDSADLRKALAAVINKDELVNEAVNSYGMRVDGYYGIGQWMYRLLSGEVAFPVEEPETDASQEDLDAYEGEIKAWEDLASRLESLSGHDGEPEEAVRLLEEDGWVLNRDGEPYDSLSDDCRCKMINGNIQALDLKLLYGEGSGVGAALELLIAPMAEAGIKLTVESSGRLLEQYYGHEERAYDLIFLARDFDVLFEPGPQFEPGGAYNYIGSDDETLYELAVNMSQTAPGALQEYCRKWMDFQERFVEVEPLIPVYSNNYFDFNPTTLADYQIKQYSTWSRAVLAAMMQGVSEELYSQEDALTE